MSKPVAIRAVYADYRRVKGRKVHQIILEIPSELWPEAYAYLGEPSIETSDWYGIARLTGEATERAEQKQPRSFTELRPSAQAALRAKEPRFQRFLQENFGELHGELVSSEEQAAEVTRTLCGVKSRALFDGDADAGDRWRLLNTAYEAWLEAT